MNWRENWLLVVAGFLYAVGLGGMVVLLVMRLL